MPIRWSITSTGIAKATSIDSLRIFELKQDIDYSLIKPVGYGPAGSAVLRKVISRNFSEKS